GRRRADDRQVSQVMLQPPDTRHWTERAVPRAWIAAAAVVAGLCVIVLGVIITSDPPAKAGGPSDAVAAAAVVRGVPQDGITLGRAGAPATLTVYTSLDATPTAFDEALPALVDRHVRPG